MTILAPGGHAVVEAGGSPPVTGFEKVLRGMSAVTLLMTLPQVFSIWIHGDARGVSVASWATYLFVACLWLVHGIRKRDKTIYVACAGWILLDAAIVIGVLVHG